MTLRDVSVTFGKHRVVGDVNLDLVRNKVTALGRARRDVGRRRCFGPSTACTTTPAAR